MTGGIYLAGIVLYSFVFVVAFILLLSIVRNKYFERNSPHFVFLVLLLAFLFCRIIWFSLDYENALYPSTPSLSRSSWGIKDNAYVISRIAFCFFFMTLSAVLYKWVLMIEIVQSTSHARLPDADWIPKLMIVVNVLFSLAILINIIIFAAANRGEAGTLSYDSGILIIANFNLLVLIAFLAWGIRLYVVVLKTVNQRLLTVLALSTIFFCCFVIRTALLWYRPISGKYINETAFDILCYFVPELIPMCSQMAIVIRVATLKRQKTIDDFNKAHEREKTSLLRSKESEI